MIKVHDKSLIKALEIKTINDTTAVKQRFHVDFFHPATKKWTSYQEDRRTMVCLTMSVFIGYDDLFHWKIICILPFRNSSIC